MPSTGTKYVHPKIWYSLYWSKEKKLFGYMTIDSDQISWFDCFWMTSITKKNIWNKLFQIYEYNSKIQ